MKIELILVIVLGVGNVINGIIGGLMAYRYKPLKLRVENLEKMVGGLDKDTDSGAIQLKSLDTRMTDLTSSIVRLDGKITGIYNILINKKS